MLKCSAHLRVLQASSCQSPDRSQQCELRFTKLCVHAHTLQWGRDRDTDHHRYCPYLQTHKYPACSDSDWHLERLYLPVIPMYSGM